MKKTDKRFQEEPAQARSLREAISLARIREAEEMDASVDRRSTELARLEVLHAAVEPVFDDIPPHEDRFALALVPSTPARLWIDMFTYVAMDSSGEVYRLVRNESGGRKVLVESGDVGVMAGRITEYVAREIVAIERQLSGRTEPPLGRRRGRGRLRIGLIISAFIIGVLTGVAGLFALGWMITQ